jgi:hypothetical protein
MGLRDAAHGGDVGSRRAGVGHPLRYASRAEEAIVSLFHKHKLALVGKTFAPGVTKLGQCEGYDVESLQRLMTGCTTYVWKCSDPACSHVVTCVALGKEMP